MKLILKNYVQVSEKCEQVQQLERKLQEVKGETQTQVCGLQQSPRDSQHQETNRLGQGVHQVHACSRHKPVSTPYTRASQL